jgi:hypothetical protein
MHGTKKLVYLSSLSVLHAAVANNRRVAEEWAAGAHASTAGFTRRRSWKRNVSCAGAVAERQLRAVILRPGLVFGPGGTLLTAAVAQRLKKRLVIWAYGRIPLPLVYIEDWWTPYAWRTERDVFRRLYLPLSRPEAFRRTNWWSSTWSLRGNASRCSACRDRSCMGGLGVSALAALLRRPAPLSIYRVRSALARITFDCRAAEERNWAGGPASAFGRPAGDAGRTQSRSEVGVLPIPRTIGERDEAVSGQ